MRRFKNFIFLDLSEQIFSKNSNKNSNLRKSTIVEVFSELTVGMFLSVNYKNTLFSQEKSIRYFPTIEFYYQSKISNIYSIPHITQISRIKMFSLVLAFLII